MPTTDPALISLIGGTQSFFILFGSFITGRLLDSGHHRHLGATGGILSTLGMFMLSITSGQGSRGDGKYWAIWLTQGLTVGLGMSCMFVYSSQVVASWFIRRRGLAIGITASGASICKSTGFRIGNITMLKLRNSLAGLIYPIMFKFLVARGSFPIAVRYLAILVGCTSFIAFLCAIPNPALILRIPDKWLAYEVWFDKSAFHRPPYPWFVAAMCFVFLGFYPIFFNLEDWAQWKGIGIKEDIANGTGGLHGESGFRTFYFLSIMNACSTVGRVLGAYLSDQYVALQSPPTPRPASTRARIAYCYEPTKPKRQADAILTLDPTATAPLMSISPPPPLLASLFSSSGPSRLPFLTRSPSSCSLASSPALLSGYPQPASPRFLPSRNSSAWVSGQV